MPTSPASTATTTAPADRREQILDVALEVFGRQGFRKGSLKEVGLATGLSVQGVLHHFPTKEALLMATLERRNLHRVARIDAVEQEHGAVAMMRLILQENLERQHFMRLFVTLAAEATDPDHPAHQYFRDRYRNLAARLSADFVADINAGRAASDLDPSDAAEQLIALCDGLQLQFLLRDDMDLLGAYDRCVHRFTRI